MNVLIGAFAAGFALIGYGIVLFERTGSANKATAVLWIGCAILAIAVTAAIALKATP